MSIGYACLAIGVPDTKIKSCVIKNASCENLLNLISHNLNALENIIEYNIKNDIKLFRISSDIIPFASSPANKLNWQTIFEKRFAEIGNKIREGGIRVSMHPGQYTVLNSPDPNTVKRAVDDLYYHAEVLDSLRVNPQNKIILHIGGIYGNKKLATERFLKQFNLLDETVKQRIAIENDDKCYNIEDVLQIGNILNIPVIFDNLHHAVNPSGRVESDPHWISLCSSTWKLKDGRQKIHYSQQDPLKKSGSHSRSIEISKFLSYYNSHNSKDTDIMLEVKDKNCSAVKCINCLAADRRISRLEHEWSRYKYLVLEKSHPDYNKVRLLLKDKESYPALAFYSIIESAINKDSSRGDAVNAAMHVWGYFKEKATEREKALFLAKTDAFLMDKIPLANIKNNLWRLAVKYDEPYLLESYYFAY